MGSLRKWWKNLKEWWSGQAAFKGALSSYQHLPLTRSGSHPRDQSQVDQSPTYQSNLNGLYWCSFRSPADTFVGVVICRGKTPAAAANRVIKMGIVESERASIVLVPIAKEAKLEQYQDKLLDEEQAAAVLEKFDIAAVIRN